MVRSRERPQVGSTDNLGVALVGCRIMRALYNQPDLKLRYLIRSHGVSRWTQRLSGDITQCGIHRQGHHDKVTAEELSKEAQLLAEDLRQGCEGEAPDLNAEWRNNQPLGRTEIEEPTGILCRAREGNRKLMEVQALHAAGDDVPGRLAPADGLFALRELLKKTEKGGLDEERCTAWELEQAGVPGLMLQYLMDDSAHGAHRCAGGDNQIHDEHRAMIFLPAPAAATAAPHTALAGFQLRVPRARHRAGCPCSLAPLALAALSFAASRKPPKHVTARRGQGTDLRDFLLQLDHRNLRRGPSNGVIAPASATTMANGTVNGHTLELKQLDVVGSWSDWDFQEMQRVGPKEFAAEVALSHPGGEFQSDWSQVFYPGGDTGAVAGPDDEGHGVNWSLDGHAGDVFRIRVFCNGDARASSVQWQWLRSEVEEMEPGWYDPLEPSWESALQKLEDLWSREKQSVEPSEDDYWQVIAACERGGGAPEAARQAQLLRQEVKERRYEGVDRFFLTPRVYWNRDVRRMGCGASNALDAWDGETWNGLKLGVGIYPLVNKHSY
eukprot:s327_g22.t1